MQRRPLIERAKDALRFARYKIQFYYSPGIERISIDQLISPLRYDVVVRMEYFRFFAARQQQFEQDFDTYLQASREHPYFTWFREIHCRRHPGLAGTERSLEDSFSQRVRSTAVLYRQFQADGFDNRMPIHLHGAASVRPTATRKTVTRRLYLGNGCHRIALLKLAGIRWLEPYMYVTQKHRKYTPPDNTAILLEHLRISPDKYFEFLSLGYLDSPQRTREGFLASMTVQQPDRMPEVMSVLSFDEPKLCRTVLASSRAGRSEC